MIYRNVWLYRIVMNLLYRGHYRARFRRVTGLIRDTDQRVLELCFGDVAIAEFCRQRGKQWTGLDISAPFVAYAARRHHDARQADVLRTPSFPACDVCIMMGSLYHFQRNLPDLFDRIRKASPRLVLSEPVRNWTHANRLLRFLARKGTRAGSGEETFRFDEHSLRLALNALKERAGFDYRVVEVARDMIVEVVWLS